MKSVRHGASHKTGRSDTGLLRDEKDSPFLEDVDDGEDGSLLERAMGALLGRVRAGSERGRVARVRDVLDASWWQ